ncbi:hypothetical protein Nepgr_029258 [Nepenthes gracilis]|uniref:DUF7733 domain-containing protein n=1 Tax=Nepenthes gracilis TaxID=150966 RepID=A0AAD3TD94_NEPGR|nr:hypothetical protein Nepgr_029258 [Nepenthes gracilis]
MSGISLAVAPRSEPETTTVPSSLAEAKSLPRKQPESVALGGVMGSLRAIELQLVAFIMVFSASGLVPLLDLVFPAFATAYVVALSRLVFPAHGKSGRESREIFRGNRLFRLYVILGSVVGLFLSLAYVLGGFARGDDHAVRSATPHLFLLSCQILTENIISGLSLFSPPVRALVPLLYTVRRIFVIIDWTVDVWLNKTLPANAHIKDWLPKDLFVLANGSSPSRVVMRLKKVHKATKINTTCPFSERSIGLATREPGSQVMPLHLENLFADLDLDILSDTRRTKSAFLLQGFAPSRSAYSWKDVAWFWFGRSLAVANLVYFSINLFGFLIPRFLPKAFEMYLTERDELHSKKAEDKRPAAANASQSQASDKKVD